MMTELLWLLPLVPLAGAAATGLLGRRLPKRAVTLVACGASGAAFVLALAAFLELLSLAPGDRRIERELFTWIAAGDFTAKAALLLDPLSAVMTLVVTGVGFIIHIYSIGYMRAQEGYYRFFAYMNLFLFSMLVLVLAGNFLLMFVGWEGVGLCSYLLIGYDFHRPAAADAGKKAFIVNRIGDFGFILGILLVFLTFGDLGFGRVFGEIAAAPSRFPPEAGIGVLTAIALLLFVGAMGKSAQIPLHVWLPDAMEGPTPVSALIHAATMVTAGVYMVVRCAPLFSRAPVALDVVLVVGSATALMAATIGLAQTDIKRVLAYSTVSQLGFMFMAAGAGAFSAGIFHLMTHAFFKALLFLGSGSVIHGVEHGFHHAHEHGHEEGHDEAHGEHAGVVERPDGRLDPHDPQDMRNMGGLFHRMPRTAWTFIIGGLALSGFPLVTAGFWSKDEILADAWGHDHTIIFIVLALAALLTAFYTARQIMMTFFGKPRTKAAVHASEHDSIFTWMTVPLMALAVFAVVGGWIGIPTSFPVLGALSTNPFHHYIGGLAEALNIKVGELAFNAVPLLTSLVVALGGLFLGWTVYRGYAARGQSGALDPLARPLGGLYRVLQNKYYFDDKGKTLDQEGHPIALNGEIAVFGSVVFDDRMRRLPTGADLAIIYCGEQRNPGKKNPTKLFTIMSDQSPGNELNASHEPAPEMRQADYPAAQELIKDCITYLADEGKKNPTPAEIVNYAKKLINDSDEPDTQILTEVKILMAEKEKALKNEEGKQ